jgi:protein-S-isoprenylcysteine O-methyltransferase Ste14
MRNPIRLKNLSLRFLPFYLIGLAVLVFHRPSQASVLAALPILALGLALRGWGAGHLVKNDALTLSGPYAHLRHPLYLGTVLVGTGFAVALGGVVGLLVVAFFWPWFVLGYFPRKERSESERLLARYGERFARYRAEVPALRPRLQPWRETAGQSGMRWAFNRYSDNNELGTLLAVCAAWLCFWARSVLS